MITLKPGTGLHTVLFDLDGTLAEGTWPSPKIGKPIQKGINLAREIRSQGYECIIFTSRPLSHHEAIAEWVHDNGLDDVFYDIICNKPRALAYIDDRAITFPEGLGDVPKVKRPWIGYNVAAQTGLWRGCYHDNKVIVGCSYRRCAELMTGQFWQIARVHHPRRAIRWIAKGDCLHVDASCGSPERTHHAPDCPWTVGE